MNSASSTTGMALVCVGTCHASCALRYETPLHPCGFVFRFVFLSTWSDVRNSNVWDFNMKHEVLKWGTRTQISNVHIPKTFYIHRGEYTIVIEVHYVGLDGIEVREGRSGSADRIKSGLRGCSHPWFRVRGIVLLPWAALLGFSLCQYKPAGMDFASWLE